MTQSPEPRSSTVSPALSSASAVGLPEPGDTGSLLGQLVGLTDLVEVARDRSAQPDSAGLQQALLRLLLTFGAACPHFSFTVFPDGFGAHSESDSQSEPEQPLVDPLTASTRRAGDHRVATQALDRAACV